MPRFQVLRRVDAFVDCVAEVEAPSADEAAARAYEGESALEWRQTGVVQFDARMFVALDDAGDEVDATRRGDF